MFAEQQNEYILMIILSNAILQMAGYSCYNPIEFYYSLHPMISTNSPIKPGKLVGNYPLVQFSSKLQLPFANILLVSARNVRRKPKKSESAKLIATPIHQKPNGSTKIQTQTLAEEVSQARKLSKLRISVLNDKKRKKIESLNSSMSNIYDLDLAKSKSLVMKKDFEYAFKKMIAKKQISSKEKQLRTSQELWSSMKMKKVQEISNLIIGQHNQGRYELANMLHTRNNSEKRLNKTANSFHNETGSFAPKLSKFYLTGHQFNKMRTPFSRFKDRQMPVQHLRNCLIVKPQGEINPWNNETRRYKTQTNEGKSGEITEWLKASGNR